ncbi:MAG: 50S ribosomal protein L19e [Methanophagales archaeon ANME-1-THS]|nr:MAG: 50S ribosomal protein L19e [Methanophagales archaeon ANME-1-THS]
MVNLVKQKRLAARMLNVGEGRVWLDPVAADKLAKALTREDIRGLIEEGVIKAHQKIGISRGRARVCAHQKSLGRRRGQGSRKGAKGSRRGKKQLWIKKIRALRARLRELRDLGAIDKKSYRMLYIQAKGGDFRNLAHLNEYLTLKGVIQEGRAK